MEYSKLLLVLCLVIALVKAVPVPQEEVELPSEAPEEEIIELEPVEEPTPIDIPVDIPILEDEPTEVEPEVEPVEPKDIGTDTNGAVAGSIGQLTNDILGNVSYNVKSAIEEELGSGHNPEEANEAINDVIVDLLTKTSEDIVNAVSSILDNDMNEADSEAIAAEVAGKISEVLNNNVADSIAAANVDVDSENVTKNVVDAATETVQGFVQKTIDTSKVVVEETLTNESHEDLAIANANDIATMVTNGVSYILKSNLCQSINDEISENCETITNSVIVSTTASLNEIIAANINSSEGGLSIGCATIPAEIFEKLSGTVEETVAAQMETENVSKISSQILALMVNAIENLLCVDRADDVNSEGNVVINDVANVPGHIINKVNEINDDVVVTLNGESDSPDQVGIASGINVLQDTLKEEAGIVEEPAEEPTEEPTEEATEGGWSLFDLF